MLTENGHVTNCSNSYTQLIAQCCHHPDCIASFREVASLHCCLSSSILLQLLLGQFATAIHSYWLMDTNIHRVLMLVWVLLFRKLIANTLIGTYIHRVASFPGPAQLSVACSTEKPWRAWYLFSREHDVIGKWRNFAELTGCVSRILN